MVWAGIHFLAGGPGTRNAPPRCCSFVVASLEGVVAVRGIPDSSPLIYIVASHVARLKTAMGVAAGPRRNGN